MLFKDLKKNLNADFSGFPVRRLGLVGDSATQFLAKAIRGYGYLERINFEVFDADYDQLDRQILDEASELHEFGAEYIVISVCAEKLWERFATTPGDRRVTFADDVAAEMEQWWNAIAARGSARVIQLNCIEINDAIFGHYAAKVPGAFPVQLKRLNCEIARRAQAHKQVFVADVAGLAAEAGLANAHDPRLYATAKVAFALDFLPPIARAITGIVKAISGDLKKCLILDLDNTVWGGIIGDDGMENIQVGDLGLGHAFDELQRWAKELRYRGIILAVCSKNDEEVARRPFAEHPDMILRLEDIAVFVANWENKAENIKRIQQTLNVGFDSMVFLDDNPFERNLVRQLLPAVTVPELPEDPALYVAYLRTLNLFETASYSDEDRQRTRQYQEEMQRTDFQKSFTSIDEYLRGLEMRSEVGPFDAYSIPRVAQLTQRSNQFNLRTVRYTEADIERMTRDPDWLTLSFSLQDRFGDHGLVGLIILKKLDDRRAFIDTWIMSCRVLKRGMEEFMVNRTAARCRAAGYECVVGEYLPTAKNKMVKDLYAQMGFAPVDGRWELDLAAFEERAAFIEERDTKKEMEKKVSL
jgi:FkbH-like protein